MPALPLNSYVTLGNGEFQILHLKNGDKNEVAVRIKGIMKCLVFGSQQEPNIIFTNHRVSDKGWVGGRR